MKKSDIIFATASVAFIVSFFIFAPLGEWFISTTKAHPFLMAFLKFAILSTAGEVIGYRIKEGRYPPTEFGVLPRAIVWGFLGMLITANMTIFSKGVVAFLMQLGIEPDSSSYGEMLAMSIFTSASWYHFLAALMISTFMNCIFAPFFMTIHKISDLHIMENSGSLSACLSSPLNFGTRLVNLDWNMMWNFLFKKTIPLFWVPAHIITFMLAPEYRVLFAALLGVMLGVFMSLATKQK